MSGSGCLVLILRLSLLAFMIGFFIFAQAYTGTGIFAPPVPDAVQTAVAYQKPRLAAAVAETKLHGKVEHTSIAHARSMYSGYGDYYWTVRVETRLPAELDPYEKVELALRDLKAIGAAVYGLEAENLWVELYVDAGFKPNSASDSGRVVLTISPGRAASLDWGSVDLWSLWLSTNIGGRNQDFANHADVGRLGQLR